MKPSVEKGVSMFTDIFFIVMFEAAETTRVEQNKDNLSIANMIGVVTMFDIFVCNHIFFLLKCKFLAK